MATSVPPLRRTTSAPPVGKDCPSMRATVTEAATEAEKEAETSSRRRMICEPALMDALERTEEEMRMSSYVAQREMTKKDRDKAGIAKLLLNDMYGDVAFFGSFVLAMAGFISYGDSNDIDVLVRPSMTDNILDKLSRYGSVVCASSSGSSVERSTTFRKVTTVTFLRGKGTIFERELMKSGDLTEMSFDIVEIPHTMTFSEGVQMMKPHVESWLATSPRDFEKVPVKRHTLDITSLDDVIKLMKSWKYMINPAYEGRILFDSPVKLKWYYFKHLQLAVRHDEKCMICQEDFLPDDKVMHLDCKCRYGRVGHCKCLMPWMIKRLQGYKKVLTHSGFPDPCHGRCICGDHTIFNNPGDVTKIFTRSLSGDFTAPLSYMDKKIIRRYFIKKN